MMKALSRTRWVELVRVLEESGAKTGEFAARHGLNPRTLGWWRSLFRREGMVASRATSRPRTGRRPRLPAQVRIARVAVMSASEPGPSSGAEAPLTLEVGAVRVLVSRGFERATLASVLSVLGVEVAR